jgi:hypothetical protein
MTIAQLEAEALQIKEETIDGANTANRVGTLFENLVTYFNDLSGWAQYTDTQYTEANPLTLTEAEGQINLPNNALGIIETQKPLYIPTFYDPATQKILGRNGDGMNVEIEYKVRPLSSSSASRIRNAINIGGTVGEVWPNDFSMNKGANVEHNYIRSLGVYTLGTWEANGGQAKVQAFNSTVEIYDIRFVFHLLHKAR